MQLFLLGLIFLFPSALSQQATARLGRIETNYDSKKDKTTVRLLAVQISGDRNQYHSVHIAPMHLKSVIPTCRDNGWRITKIDRRCWEEGELLA